MEDTEESSQWTPGRQVIVRADEVDQDGTPISSGNKQLPQSALDQRDGAAPATTRAVQAKNTRPVLRRDASTPLLPSQPPPLAPPLHQKPDTTADSLSLPQLKHLVSQFPKVEQRAYAFHYADAQSFAEEIEEWFQYSEQDGNLILSAKDTFEQKWRLLCGSYRGHAEEEDLSWPDVSDRLRRDILSSVLSSLNVSDQLTRIESLEVIFYILGGVWATTAGVESHGEAGRQPNNSDADKESNSVQIEWMHKGADLMLECTGLQRLQDCTRMVFDISNDGR